MVPRVESYNEMFFKNSDEIDGTIVSEVRQGRDGVSVKLIDKKFALDKLDRYFDLFPDEFKRRIEEEKLKLAQRAAQDDNEDEFEDDGFLDAIEGKTKEGWGDEGSGTESD
ncbi:terminase small subunit [Domibacillus sp. A3M-37]|uniref:terminase small subunit n=1 Tax=Domibacillus sp. A3M-37 TaxID=2962037 RepID=UPI0035C1E49A